MVCVDDIVDITPVDDSPSAAYTHKTITRSVNNNARVSEKYAVHFQLMFV